MKYVVNLIRREPVLVQGAIQAMLAMLAGFGVLHWSGEQTGVVLAFTAALMAVIARANTQPVADLAPADLPVAENAATP